MNLDELKKSALDKTMSFKLFRDRPEQGKKTKSDEAFEEIAKNMEVVMDDSDPDGDMGSTRKFNLRDMLSELRGKAKDFASDAEETAKTAADTVKNAAGAAGEIVRESRTSADTENSGAAENETSAPNDREAAKAPDTSYEPVTIEAVSPAPSSAEIGSLCRRLDKIEEELCTIRNADTEHDTRAGERMDDLFKRLSTIKNMLEKHSDSDTKSIVNLNAKLNAQDERLTDITASLGSVSKLNDSIFDLKNTQMNTRNSIDELANSYRRLKKKMIGGMTLISILTAVLIVLEVLNLFS